MTELSAIAWLLIVWRIGITLLVVKTAIVAAQLRLALTVLSGIRK